MGYCTSKGNKNYGAKTSPSAVMRGQLERALRYSRETDKLYYLVLRSLGFQDFGLESSEIPREEFLNRVGIARANLESAVFALEEIGQHADDIYTNSIRQFADGKGGTRVVPMQALNLNEAVPKHLYN